MRSLLDINVVITLLDPDHDFHHRAHRWWKENRTAGWASCPLTENGVVRIMSNPSYNPRRSLTPEAIIAVLRSFAAATDHEFWADSVSLLDNAVVDPTAIFGPRQITDIYLLALASAHEARFATFDESIHLGAVRSASPVTLVTI